MTIKPALDDYPAWHLSVLGEDLNSEAVRNKYAANITLAQAGINEHPFIQKCSKVLGEMATDKTFALTSGSKAPEIAFSAKPYASVIDKTFRHNCNWNRSFPNEPRGGWVLSSNWFATIDDLIRTSLVCRYLDGPEQVCSKIDLIAKELGLSSLYEPRATDEGYYAYHCYVKIPVQLMIDEAGAIQKTPVEIEIQVTTQLQEILRDLTHPFYEARRIAAKRALAVERWDFGTGQFRASYLAHTLHLIEGMIVQLRNENLKRTKPAARKGAAASEKRAKTKKIASTEQ
jgi:ppGpp synthetase/RelA/SpoT-type nucleotidyltranferase